MADAPLTVTELSAWLHEFARLIDAHKAELTALDAAIGDADHGTNLDRGMRAVTASLAEAPATLPGPMLKQVGMTLVSRVGGASGPLYGTFFLRLATSFGEVEQVNTGALAAALRAGVEGVVARGRAEPGDKTMYDALAPAVDALDRALADGATRGEGLAAALTAAEAGRDATVPMRARKGRASYLGERSVGHQDPGATSAVLLLAAAAGSLG